MYILSFIVSDFLGLVVPDSFAFDVFKGFLLRQQICELILLMFVSVV